MYCLRFCFLLKATKGGFLKPKPGISDIKTLQTIRLDDNYMNMEDAWFMMRFQGTVEVTEVETEQIAPTKFCLFKKAHKKGAHALNY